MKALTALFALLFFLSSSTSAFAAIFINEFSSDSSTEDDWIEIYNSGPNSVDLGKYRLRDDSTSNKLDLEGSINAGNFKVFSWNSKLNKTGDIIKLILIADENNILDLVGYGDKGTDVAAPNDGQSAGRKSDGSMPWIIFSSPSKESSNATATPAPTPTPSPAPTEKPTPTPTKTPTPTEPPNTPTGSVKSASTKSSSKSANISAIPTSRLEKSKKEYDQKQDEEKKVLIESTSQKKLLPTIITIIGSLFFISAAIIAFRQIKNNT